MQVNQQRDTRASVSVIECTTSLGPAGDAFTSCTNSVHQSEISPDDLSIDPALLGATLKTNVDGCMINVSFTGTGTPSADSFQAQELNDNYSIFTAEDFQRMKRYAIGTGTACGHTVSYSGSQYGLMRESLGIGGGVAIPSL